MWLPLAVTLVILGALWQWGAKEMPYLLPPLPAVGQNLTGYSLYLTRNAAITLGESMAGLAMAFVAAFALAVGMSEVTVIRRAFLPLAVVLNVTPVVAITPALVVAFGFGPAPKLIITGLICFFTILINTATGLRSVPREMLQVYQTLDASRWELLRHLRIPSAMPYLFAALRIVVPLSVVGAVVAEMTAAGSAGGLGTVILTQSGNNNLAMVWAAIFVLALMGVLLLFLVTVAERRALRWHHSVTSQPR